ncbi:MAG: D-aspartate ligase [Solirubrobacteraceae bacterium]|nr:D-aspartate ligase [Solirubrobacteraceae bacterium]
MTATADGTGAIVVGGDYQGLGIVRSLGRHGVPVCVVDDELSIGRFSRFTTRAVRAGGLRDGERCVATLLELGRRFGLDGWVLFPTREETVVALARHGDELRERFRVPTPPWETIRWAWDKRGTQAVAERLGVPTARTWTLRGGDDLGAVPADARYPLVIKPAIKEHFIYATGDKAWRADTPAELAQRARQAAEIVGPGEVLVQELIPGDGRMRFAYCTFFKDGEPVAGLTVRRQRQHPPQFGRASTLVESVDLPELEEPSTRFLREIGYYGLAELEYMFDARDRTYKLLDVNARTWGYHSIGPAAGIDFPWLLFADQLGIPVSAPRWGRAGVRWVRLVTDLPTAAVEMLGGQLGLRRYLASMRPLHVESVFCRDDPVPGVAELGLVPYLMVKRGF